MATERADLAAHFDHRVKDGSDFRENGHFLRENCPIAHSDQYGGFWAVSRYDDVVDVLADHRQFGNAQGNGIPEFRLRYPFLPTASDEPLHSAYRKILWPALTPRAVTSYEPFVRSAANSLIDDFIGTGSAEIVSQFAKPVVAQVMTQFFQFDPEEALHCYTWFSELIESGDGDPQAALATSNAMFGFFQDQVDRARHDPGDDLVSTIVAATVDGRPVTNDESVGLVATAVLGAIESTVAAVAESIRLLGMYPRQRARLVDEPSLIASAVEEILRYESPAPGFVRTAGSEARVGDQALGPGEKVYLHIDGANFDPDRFGAPEEFRVDRNPTDHLAFGHGIHKCQGMHLARMELRVVLEEFLARIPDYELLEDVTPVVQSGMLRTLKQLPIVFPVGNE